MVRRKPIIVAQRGSDPTSDVPLSDLRGGGQDGEEGKPAWAFMEGTDLHEFDSAYWNPNAGWPAEVSGRDHRDDEKQQHDSHRE